MRASSYPASRAIASKASEYFAGIQADHRAQSESGSTGLNLFAEAPSPESIEAMITEAFWASLRRNEDYRPTISLAYLAPLGAAHPLLFEKPFPLAADALARLAPAVERAGVHLGVFAADALPGHPASYVHDVSSNDAPGEADTAPSGLAVWGAIHALPPLCFVIEVIEPGLLVIKQSSSGDAGKYVNVAVFEGDRVKEMMSETPIWPDSPPLVKYLLGAASTESSSVLIQLASSMRRHGRGGLLLMVPSGSDAWRQSILSPMSYPVSPLYGELRDMTREGKGQPAVLSDPVMRVIHMVAGLTAVDGASVMTRDYELLAFGAKITRREHSRPVERVVEREPIGSGHQRLVHPSALGGTRHLSAAQFAQDQHDSTALVASQDGRFTVFSWSEADQMVHAYRVESLLL